MLPTCDLATLVDRVRRLGGDAPTVAIDGERFARLDVLGRCLQDRLPGLTVVADASVRIWMEDPGGFSAHVRAEKAKGTWVPGRWVANISPEQQAAVDAQDADERRRREAADLVFVGLDHFDSVIELDFFAEDSCDFVLWDDNGSAGEIEALLPIEDELRERIRRWAVEANDLHNHGSAEAGRALAEELQQRLGPAYRINYLP